MKAIETHYLGPTNTKGTRIVAHDGDNNRIVVDYTATLTLTESYRAAAEALCNKMGWKGELVGGATKRGYTFVFVTNT